MDVRIRTGVNTEAVMLGLGLRPGIPRDLAKDPAGENFTLITF